MSDVSAAAAALGIPEDLVERSAEARATASGMNVEDLLAQWAGGEAAPAGAGEDAAADTAAPADLEVPDEAASEAAPEPEPAAPEAAPEIVIDVPEPEREREVVPTGPHEPPVLVGAKDSPMTVLAGVVALFAMVVLVGLVGPSIPTEAAGARSSEIAYSDGALDGQTVYQTAGCASCHSQMVRPVVADVGLGAVTLGDTNQVLGTRRFGPDLSDIGTRMSATQIEATIEGLDGHPVHVLDARHMADLVAYLSESTTSAAEEVES